MKSYLFPELDLTFESQYQFFALKLSLTSFFFFFDALRTSTKRKKSICSIL